MDLERTVLEVVNAAEERGDPPLVWAVEVGRCVQARGLELPSVELGEVVVGSLCFANNRPSLWKFLDQAIASGLVSPLHALALLTARVIPHHQIQPEAYRLYLELLNRYALSFSSKGASTCREKIAKSVNDALQLTHNYDIPNMDFGKALILFLFTVITRLIDCALEDLGLQLSYSEKNSSSPVCAVNQDFLAKENLNDKRHEYREHLRKRNTSMAMEVAEKLTADKKAEVLLHLVHKNINRPETFNCLLQRLQLIEIQKSKSQNLLLINHILVRLSVNIRRAMDDKFQLNKRRAIGGLINVGSHVTKFCTHHVASLPACWVPFDIFMENTMDGKHLYATSAIDILTELTKTLQVVNQATWQETFQALWVSALKLVQREREPIEGPIPHLDARLCVLLSITPLAIAGVMKQDVRAQTLMKSDVAKDTECDYKDSSEGSQCSNIRHGLASSIQLLRQFTGLLSPPPSVVTAATNAARKAASFTSNFKNGASSCNSIDHGDTSVEAVGSMLHLIVEACIARKLLDTSAYFWPGYVVTSSLPMSPPIQSSPWTTFMEGAQLTHTLTNALVVTPASSVTEVEKLYHLALNGSEEERAASSKILCGASLSRGWNIQEHVMHSVIKLLSTPVPSDFSRPGSHLFSYMAMISSILFGVCHIDIVHMISVYGMVPDVAAALMPICEAFGSLSPASNYRSSTGEEISAYSIFSCAFLFLLRLWKFYRPPQEHCIGGRWGTVRLELTLDHLLLMHNGNVALNSSDAMDIGSRITDPYDRPSVEPIYIASFPKLRAWYSQHQACLASTPSTISGLCSGNPVHQVANKILNMIFRKMTSSGNSSGNPSSASSSNLSGSPINSGEAAYQRPNLPAWEIMESLPFVLEALLAACAHGRLSSRDLTTGLRDLVDFLPASLATIISYFSAEITRGIWKPVPMNGIEWPSPAANLLSIEAEIKDLLACAGVHVPTCYAGGTTPVMLPLPMAALVSLTITFKLDKSLEYIHGVAGSALENCTTACAWPCMPIIGALWAQKVRRWHDFIVMSCARLPFERDQGAVQQLLRSCFTSYLGPSLNSGLRLTARGGVNGLLGHALTDHSARLSLAPGLLYLRSCRMFYDTHFVTDEILKLVVESARRLASGWGCGGQPARGRSARTSLAAAAAAAKEAAMLGASLLCIAGGADAVQVLYKETMPTWLLSARAESEEEEEGGAAKAGPASRILEGYAMAYMIILSGSFVWGLGEGSTFWLGSAAWRSRAIRGHTDFVAWALEGNISLGCNPATWKAYVSCLLGVMAQFTPAWVAEVEPSTLRKLASGLRGWHECELALSLLEKGGPDAITFVVDAIS